MKASMESSITKLQREIKDLFGVLAETEDNADTCMMKHKLSALFKELAKCEKSATVDSPSSLADYCEDRKLSFLEDKEAIFDARAENQEKALKPHRGGYTPRRSRGSQKTFATTHLKDQRRRSRR